MGLSNYAINIISKERDKDFFKKIIDTLVELKIEFRLGSAGGGNQLKQPYLKNILDQKYILPNTDHVHYFGCYIGNFPDLEFKKIDFLTEKLNKL